MTNKRRVTVSIFAIAAMVGLLSAVPFQATACAPKTANLSPAGQRAFTADQFLQRVHELQNAVIDANDKGNLADAPAIRIVKFTRDAAIVARTAPADWQTQVKALYVTARQELLLTFGPPPAWVQALLTPLEQLLGIGQAPTPATTKLIGYEKGGR